VSALIALSYCDFDLEKGNGACKIAAEEGAYFQMIRVFVSIMSVKNAQLFIINFYDVYGRPLGKQLLRINKLFRSIYESAEGLVTNRSV
jgi:hypothetical protein